MYDPSDIRRDAGRSKNPGCLRRTVPATYFWRKWFASSRGGLPGTICDGCAGEILVFAKNP
jgi:hypothetical protein